MCSDVLGEEGKGMVKRISRIMKRRSCFSLLAPASGYHGGSDGIDKDRTLSGFHIGQLDSYGN